MCVGLIFRGVKCLGLFKTSFIKTSGCMTHRLTHHPFIKTHTHSSSFLLPPSFSLPLSLSLSHPLPFSAVCFFSKFFERKKMFRCFLFFSSSLSLSLSLSPFISFVSALSHLLPLSHPAKQSLPIRTSISFLSFHLQISSLLSLCHCNRLNIARFLSVNLSLCLYFTFLSLVFSQLFEWK